MKTKDIHKMKPIAQLTIRNINDLNKGMIIQLARWLQDNAETVLNQHDELSNVFTSKFWSK